MMKVSDGIWSDTQGGAIQFKVENLSKINQCKLLKNKT